MFIKKSEADVRDRFEPEYHYNSGFTPVMRPYQVLLCSWTAIDLFLAKSLKTILG
jgi:hypothetical protein